jgi:hypothetical protein
MLAVVVVDLKVLHQRVELAAAELVELAVVLVEQAEQTLAVAAVVDIITQAEILVLADQELLSFAGHNIRNI